MLVITQLPFEATPNNLPQLNHYDGVEYALWELAGKFDINDGVEHEYKGNLLVTTLLKSIENSPGFESDTPEDRADFEKSKPIVFGNSVDRMRIDLDVDHPEQVFMLAITQIPLFVVEQVGTHFDGMAEAMSAQVAQGNVEIRPLAE